MTRTLHLLPRTAIPAAGSPAVLFTCAGPGCGVITTDVVFFDAGRDEAMGGATVIVLCFSCVERYQKFLLREAPHSPGDAMLASLIRRFCTDGPSALLLSFGNFR